MIRQPSSMSQLYAWHRRAVQHPDAWSLEDGVPHCGWYKMRLVKGGPWVPAEIRIEQDIDPDTGDLAADERFALYVEGIRQDDPEAAHDRMTWLTPISQAEFHRLMDMRLRDSRFFDARQPIDLSAAPSPPPGV